MQIKDLAPNPKNPRVASDEKIHTLKKTLEKFGDLSGVVFNRKTKHLVSGHQRVKTFSPETKIAITKKYAKPSKFGTVAEGYIALNGERIYVRIVSWDSATEKAAMIAANAGAGAWEKDLLSDIFQELDSEGFDLDLTLFDPGEREEFIVPDFESDDSSKGKDKKKSKGTSKIMHECPECGHEFN